MTAASPGDHLRFRVGESDVLFRVTVAGPDYVEAEAVYEEHEISISPEKAVSCMVTEDDGSWIYETDCWFSD